MTNPNPAAPLTEAINDCGKDDCTPVEHWQRLYFAARAVADERARKAWIAGYDKRAELAAMDDAARATSTPADFPPVGMTPETRCPRCFGGYFRCEDPWHEQGATSTPAGLREALEAERGTYLRNAEQAQIDYDEFPRRGSDRASESARTAPMRWRARAEGIEAAIRMVAPLSKEPTDD